MAVSEAIKNGRLVHSVIRVNAAGFLDPAGVPKIVDFALADQEWAKNTDTQKRANAAGGLVAPDFHGPAPVPLPLVAQPSPRPSPVEDVETIASATERLKTAQADLAELNLQEKRGELVSAADVSREWSNILSQARSKLLGVPTRFRQAVPTATTENVATLENLIREALEDLVAVGSS
jgi:hypothetical protein